MADGGNPEVCCHVNLHHFIVSAILVMGISYLAVGFSRRLGFGSILGLLAAGAVLGPSGLKVTDSAGGLREFTELGIVFLLFVIGLELRPAKLWQMRGDVLGLGLVQVVATGGALTLFVHFCGARIWSHAALGGVVLALSSTAFVLTVMEDRKELRSEHGQVSLAVLLAQDLAAVPLLALVPIVARSDGLVGASHSVPLWSRLGVTVAALAAIGLMGRVAVPYLLKRNVLDRNPSGFAVITIMAVLAAAWLTAWVGLSMAFGAFMVGLLLSGTKFQLQIESVAERWKEMLLSLFFVAVGMNMNLAVLRSQGLIVLLLALGILLIKPLVLYFLCKLFRKSTGTSIRTALLCAQCGEFAFVLTAQSERLGIIDAENASVGILTISITMALTPFLAKLADYWGRKAEPVPTAPRPTVPLLEIAEPAVIVGGFGCCGEAVCAFLRERQVAYAALDLDWDRVAGGRQRGYAVSGGDMTQWLVLKHAGAAQCRLMVIATDDENTSERTIEAFRMVAPASVPIVARAKDRAAAAKLEAAGATHLVVEHDEIGRRLVDSLRLALETLDAPGDPPKGGS